MGNEKLIVIIQLILFIVLLYTLFSVSKKDKITPLAKWVIMLASISIVALADKVKIIFFVLGVSIIWLLDYSPIKKRNGSRKSLF